jgi:hypothetical protein
VTADKRAGAILNIANPPVLDIALTEVAGITSMIPVAGSVLGAQVQAWRDHAALRRLVGVLLDFHDGLSKVERDLEYLNSGGFQVRLEEIVESSVQARNAEKRRHFGAAMARSASVGRPEDHELDQMLDTLDRLRPIHLSLLAAVAGDPNPSNAAVQYLPTNTERRKLIDSALPGVDSNVLRRCWEDLASAGIFVSEYLVSDGSWEDEEPPNTAVTSFGRRFLAFITPP